MASRTVTVLSDDLDGGEADESVEFALDGVTYEIDLKTENADGLRQLLDRYIQAGRRVGGRKHLGASPGARSSGQRTTVPAARRPMDTADRAALKRFAVANGYKVPADRGRVSRELVQLWEEAGKPA